LLKILVCEDTQADAQALEACLRASRLMRGVDYAIDIYRSTRQALLNFDPRECDILFLDILMEESPDGPAAPNAPAPRMPAQAHLVDTPVNGVELARQVRLQDPDIPIVFVTSSRDFAVDSYEVRATHYLLKPVTTKGVDEALERCREAMGKGRRYLEVTVGYSTERVFVSDLVWAESFGKRVTLHLTQGTMETSTPLATILDQGGPSLLRCHRSYVVNMDHVSRTQGKSFCMVTGDEVPIRTNGAGKVIDDYRTYLFNRVHGNQGAGI